MFLLGVSDVGVTIRRVLSENIAKLRILNSMFCFLLKYSFSGFSPLPTSVLGVCKHAVCLFVGVDDHITRAKAVHFYLVVSCYVNMESLFQ